jgi:DNA-binding response OmpR family regulator
VNETMSGREDIHSLPVLLVDDEFQLLLFYRKTLEKSGFQQIVTLDDSRQVMPFLAKQLPALIVLDYSMPFLNGKDLLVMIKEEYPQIPVLFVTALDDLETAVECMRLGAFDYLLKPFDSERMVTSIQKALEMHALQQQVEKRKDILPYRHRQPEDAGHFQIYRGHRRVTFSHSHQRRNRLRQGTAGQSDLCGRRQPEQFRRRQRSRPGRHHVQRYPVRP